MDKHELEWANGCCYNTENTGWNCYNKSMCYSNSGTYCNLDGYRVRHYTIYKFSDIFITDNSKFMTVKQRNTK